MADRYKYKQKVPTCEPVLALAVPAVVLGHAVRPLGAGDGRADVHAGPEVGGAAVALVGPARLRGVAVGVGAAAALGLAAAGQLVLDLAGAAGADGEAARVQLAPLALGAGHDLARVQAGAPPVDVHL